MLFDLIRLVCVKGSDAFLLESVFRNEVWGFMQLPVSKDNEKLVLDTLVGYCEGALDGYETSDAEDAKAQSNGALPLRARMAAAAKLGEKKALRQSLQVFLDDLDTIDDKEYYQVWSPAPRMCDSTSHDASRYFPPASLSLPLSPQTVRVSHPSVPLDCDFRLAGEKAQGPQPGPTPGRERNRRP